MVGPMAGDESLDDLGRELRERVGHEVQREAEMIEHDAASLQLRRRRLEDVATELVSRGDTVTVIAGARSIRGTLVYARGEIASVAIADGPAFDVHLRAGVMLRVDERSPAGGRAARRGSNTLRARLLEHELSGTSVEVWVPAHGVEAMGSIQAVGKDHLILTDRDGAEWVVVLDDIAWVRPA